MEGLYVWLACWMFQPRIQMVEILPWHCLEVKMKYFVLHYSFWRCGVDDIAPNQHLKMLKGYNYLHWHIWIFHQAFIRMCTWRLELSFSS